MPRTGIFSVGKPTIARAKALPGIKVADLLGGG